MTQRERPAGRGRGRGRGGAARGLLSDRGQANSGPSIVSGPFSLGPSASKTRSSVAPVNVGFAGGISRGGPSGTGSGRGGAGSIRGPGSGRAAATAQSSSTFADDDEVVQLEKMISNVSMELGQDFCPVHIYAAPKTEPVAETETPNAGEIIQNPGQLFLIQMPSRLPVLEEKAMEVEGEEGKRIVADGWQEGTEGEYGKLCIHASGRVSMLINGMRYFLDPNVSASCSSTAAGSQSVVAIDPEYEQSFELGQVNNTFIANLDLASIKSIKQ